MEKMGQRVRGGVAPPPPRGMEDPPICLVQLIFFEGIVKEMAGKCVLGGVPEGTHPPPGPKKSGWVGRLETPPVLKRSLTLTHTHTHTHSHTLTHSHIHTLTHTHTHTLTLTLTLTHPHTRSLIGLKYYVDS